MTMMTEDELMYAATEEVVYSNVYYGKALLTVWAGRWPKDADGKVCGAPVRWTEADGEKEKVIFIDFLLDLCPGCKATYQVKAQWKSGHAYDSDWQKIVVPSLKEIGAADAKGHVDLKQVKDHWVKVQRVEGTRPREKGNPDKGNWNTYKFLAIYKSEEECRQAMALDNGEDIPGITGTTAPKGNAGKQDDRRQAALEFCKVAIGTYKGMPVDEIRKAAETFISSNPNVSPYVKIDDAEIKEMINEVSIPY